MATSDIAFTTRPTPADRDAVAELEVPGDDLFPVGVAHRAYLELFLDARGRLLAYGIPDGSLGLVGETFEDGIERLLLGIHWPGHTATKAQS